MEPLLKSTAPESKSPSLLPSSTSQKLDSGCSSQFATVTSLFPSPDLRKMTSRKLASPPPCLPDHVLVHYISFLMTNYLTRHLQGGFILVNGRSFRARKAWRQECEAAAHCDPHTVRNQRDARWFSTALSFL